MGITKIKKGKKVEGKSDTSCSAFYSLGPLVRGEPWRALSRHSDVSTCIFQKNLSGCYVTRDHTRTRVEKGI